MATFGGINDLVAHIRVQADAEDVGFHYGYLSDLMSSNMGVLGGEKKFPMLVLIPPDSYYPDIEKPWERFDLIFYCLVPEKKRTQDGRLELEGYHDKTLRSARSVIVGSLTRDQVPNGIRWVDKRRTRIRRAKNIGPDKLAGVRLDLKLDLNVGCV